EHVADGILEIDGRVRAVVRGAANRHPVVNERTIVRVFAARHGEEDNPAQDTRVERLGALAGPHLVDHAAELLQPHGATPRAVMITESGDRSNRAATRIVRAATAGSAPGKIRSPATIDRPGPSHQLGPGGSRPPSRGFPPTCPC